MSETMLRLAVMFARALVRYDQEPQPGDLCVEVTGWRRSVDPDAIGYLVGHGPAPYHEDDPLDGSVPMREVWDMRPLNSNARLQEWGGQRWENAQFRPIPEVVRRALPGLGIVEP